MAIKKLKVNQREYFVHSTYKNCLFYKQEDYYYDKVSYNEVAKVDGQFPARFYRILAKLLDKSN